MDFNVAEKGKALYGDSDSTVQPAFQEALLFVWHGTKELQDICENTAEFSLRLPVCEVRILPDV